MICEVHDKEMKQNSRGWFCSTPVRKSPDGKTVLEWCTWKPSQQPRTPSQVNQREELTGQVLASINLKIDKVLEGQARIEAKIDAITPNGVRPVTSGGPLSEEKKLPF